MNVYVKFKDSKRNYHTSVNKLSNVNELESYFVNTYFNVGIYPKEDMQECIGIDITKDHDEVYIEKIYPLADMDRYDFHKFMVWNRGEKVVDIANKVMYFDNYKEAKRVKDAWTESNKLI